MHLPLNQILLGDCLELLKSFPDASVDAVVVDPPYGLGAKDPSPIDIFMYVLGGGLDTGGDFMGKDWEIPSVAVWREVHRVLKPGGYVTCFAGTRTFDVMSIGLRMAGFECRDTGSRFFPSGELPVLQWVHGEGMPKGSNLRDSIVERLGADSPEVCRWTGWNSNLKPAWEPILLFRKPFKGTLVDNVLKHGTGGLNIDATRVVHASKEDFDNHRKGVEAIREKGGKRGRSWKNDSDLSGANEVTSAGRWPANCILEHSALCRKVGTQEISPHPQGPDRFQKTSGGKFSSAYGNQLAADESEVLPLWDCVEGCPVRALDTQSGDRPSTLTGRADPNSSHEHPGKELNPNSTFLGERTHLSRVYADAGGASRFFTQLEAEGGVPFKYVPKANRREAGSGEFEVEHITLKPLSLIRWLVRLVTPKGGVVLDCYAGSGTTCHAALLEEMSYVGIERDPENHAEALKRLEVAQRLADERREAQELFDFAMGRT